MESENRDDDPAGGQVISGGTATEIVLVGASIRAAAQSARRAGFRVIGVDLFGDRDTRQACHRFALMDDRDVVVDLLDQYPRASVVCVGGFADPPSALRSLGPHARRIETALGVQARMKDPEALGKLAAAGQWSFPETITPLSAQFDRDAPRDGRWLIKPVTGSGGIGVRWFDGDAESVQPGESLQRFIAGRRFGATLVVDSGHSLVLGICRSLVHRHRTRPRADVGNETGSETGSDRVSGDNDRELDHRVQVMPFLYAGSFGPMTIGDESCRSLVHRLIRIGNAIHGQFGFVGLCNIDIIVDPDGEPWLLEINPRWSGSSEVIERSLTGRSLTELSLTELSLTELSLTELSLTERVSADQPRAETSPVNASEIDVPMGNLFAIGRDPIGALSAVVDANRQTYKRILYAPQTDRPVTFWLQSVAPEIRPGVAIADVPADGTVIEPGWPICSVLVDVRGGDVMRALSTVRTIRDRILREPHHFSFSSANDLMR